MLFNKQSKLGLLAVALALSGTVLGLQSTNASAYGPVRVDHLHVTVVGEAPLLHLSNKQNEFVLDGNTLSVNYSYQHAETIEFELINQADSSIRATKRVDVSKKSTYGDDIVSLNLSTLPEGDYTLTAKLSGTSGYAEDEIAFSYSGETAILASATISSDTLAIMEKAASASATISAPQKISETDRIITSVLLGTLAMLGSFFAIRRFVPRKPRSLVPDSAISFA